MENLVDETFWSDILHVHLEWCFHGNRKNKVYCSFPMKATLYAIIDKSNETSCDNNTYLAVRKEILCTR
jgi:hypothetical protein